jgi:hypothetical protein
MAPNYLSRFGVVYGTCTDRPIMPEAELWTAVILQAIDDLDRRTSLTPRLAQDSAREWFSSESDAVGSFIWTCHVIDMDPNFIRSRLAKKQRMQNPVKVVVTSRTQRMKTSRAKGFAIFQEPANRAQPSQVFKRVVVGL